MKVSCPTCQTNYNIDDKRIPPGGAKLKCAKCQNTFPIRAPSDGVATPAAIPLPGTAAPQSAAIPLPGSAAPQSAAIPLPGSAAPQSAAIPLPGAAEPYSAAIPLPGSAASQSAAIPLPGAAEPYSDAIPLPGAAPAPDAFGAVGGGQDYMWDEQESTRVMPLSTLPSAAFREPLPEQAPAPAYDPYSHAPAPDPYGQAQSTMGGHTDQFAAYEPTQVAQAAIPLPGGADPQQAMPMSEEPTGYGDAIPLPGVADPNDPFALPPPPAAEGYADPSAYTQVSAPLQEDPFALPPPQEDPFALPPPPAGDPLGDAYASPPPTEQGFSLPEMQPPPTEVAPAHAFAFPPPPAAGHAEPDPFAAVDLSEPAAPAPAPDLNIDFGTPAPPAAQASPPPPASFNVGTDFGDVSFDDPPPPSASPSAADSLEFDPTAPAKPSAGDDLEVDLSAPLPPPPTSGAADALEMLSFIDDAAKDSGAKAANKVKRFHVRRRSGKVFGPFEEGVIVKMLEEGQLLGNEDVSTDSDNWTPIGTVASFAAAIQKLMEGPSSKTG
ncbi:MAG TPA: zinc-ribbon domain-containing protein, partial [Hyalangium sp.]|nr:zinc-ribbon domain-containing protein [Hyalangium sp.]